MPVSVAVPGTAAAPAEEPAAKEKIIADEIEESAQPGEAQAALPAATESVPVLVLLCYKLPRKQHGQRGRDLARCIAIWRRSVEME